MVSLETVITVIKQTYPSTWSYTVTFKVKNKSTCSEDKCFTKLCFYPHFTCICKYRSSNTRVGLTFAQQSAVSADRIIDVDVGMLDTSAPVPVRHFGTRTIRHPCETFRHQEARQFGTRTIRHLCFFLWFYVRRNFLALKMIPRKPNLHEHQVNFWT